MNRIRILSLAKLTIPAIVVSVFLQSASVVAQEAESAIHKPATVEHYYRVKWGYFDEFYALLLEHKDIPIRVDDLSDWDVE